MDPTEVELIPQIPDTIDFQEEDPESYGNLPPPIRGTDLKPDFTFKHFLEGLGVSGLELWEISAGRVVGTSDIGGKIFLDLGKMLIYFYQNGEFCGDILNRVRITENYNVHYPYPTVKATDSVALSNGIKIDIQHFRRMVAKLIHVSFRDYSIEFSNTVKLFFSKVFYIHADYLVLQLLHPLFYNSIERLNFIQLVDEYMKEYAYGEQGLAGFRKWEEYGFVNWWTQIPPTSICQDVLHFEDNFDKMYCGRPENLILFLRNCHGRLNRKKKATHLEADSMLHHLFPDVCAVAIDAIIRAEGSIDLISNDSQYTLMEYFFESPFGFKIIPYRYPGVHFEAPHSIAQHSNFLHSKGLED